MIMVEWDIDDVMWMLNYEAAKHCGIPFCNLIDFHANANDLLTPAEKAALNDYYTDPEHFRNIPWGSGLAQIPDLIQFGVKSRLNSNSYTVAGRDFKIAGLREQIPRFDELEQKFGLVDGNTTVKKRFDDSAVILVDDSPYNAATFSGPIIVTPFTPWIQTAKAQSLLRGKEVHYFCYGHPYQAIEIVKNLAIRLTGNHSPS